VKVVGQFRGRPPTRRHGQAHRASGPLGGEGQLHGRSPRPVPRSPHRVTPDRHRDHPGVNPPHRHHRPAPHSGTAGG
jgi:hypothetical protein